MIKSILHFFNIHRKVIFGNSTIVVQDMLSVTPESFNAIDVVLAAISERLGMVKAMVYAQRFSEL